MTQNTKKPSLSTWLDSLAAQQPTPGGGAAAGLAAATAAALVSMVSSYTTGEKWQDREKEIATATKEAAELRKRSLELMQADDEAFQEVLRCYQLPSNTQEEKAFRAQALETALGSAAKPPQQLAVLTHRIVRLLSDLALLANPALLADVAVAASFARCAIESSVTNMRANKKYINDPLVRESMNAVLQTAVTDIQVTHAIINDVRERLENS